MTGLLTKEQREEIERELKRCIWFSGKDAMAWALNAYYGACRETRPPEGEPWDNWTSPSGFLEAFQYRMTELLSVEVIRRELPHPGSQAPEIVWANDLPPWPFFIGRWRGRWGGLGRPANEEIAATHDAKLPLRSEDGATVSGQGVPGAA